MPAKTPGRRATQTPATPNAALEGTHEAFFKQNIVLIFEMGFSPFQTGAMWCCRYITKANYKYLIQEITSNHANYTSNYAFVFTGKPE